MVLATSLRPSEPPRMTVVGRQAILDPEREVAAYELLYRSSDRMVEAGVIDDLAATATVMVSSVVELGLDAVAGDKDVFLNCSTEVLSLPLDELLPAPRVVLEVLESVPLSDALVERLGELRRMGFRIALDDFVLGDPRSALLPLSDLVKVDLIAVGSAGIERLVAELSSFRGTLLAEKVETEDEFLRCKALGFTLFQGYFFCRPITVSRRTGSPQRHDLFAILATVQRPDVSLDAAVAAIQRDVTVSYRMLKCLNSVVFGMRQPVDSLRQALILLGMPRVRAWVSLMALSAVRGKSSELVRMALIRASMCQELSAHFPGTDRESMFTVGLLSMLDGILGMSMDEVVAQLPLGPTVGGALLGRPGPARALLEAVVAYERGHFAGASDDMDLDAMGAAWLTSVAWAERLSSSLLAD